MEGALSNTNPGQVIQVPNTLRLKVGGRLGGIDPAAIAKAEAALKSLSGNFSQWMNDELAKLETARGQVRAEGLTTETCEALYLRDPDDNGVELYCDSPEKDWPRDSVGNLKMFSRRLDLEALLRTTEA